MDYPEIVKIIVNDIVNSCYNIKPTEQEITIYFDDLLKKVREMIEREGGI